MSELQRRLKFMSVESWDPRGAKPQLDAAAMARLLEAAAAPDAPAFGLAPDEAGRLGRLARHPDQDWHAAGETLGDDDVIALIRFFTLAEMRLPGWDLGAQSPVVPLVALLKRRGRYPAGLTGWIKAHTDNRFLPYGNLMDRLQ